MEDFDVQEFDEKSPEFVMGFQEAQQRARAGGGTMATQIEGGGRLARLQEILQFRDKGSQQERQFLSTFFELRNSFAESDEVYLKDKFLALKNSAYKSPAAFLFAEYILRAGNGAITKAAIQNAKQLAIETESDVTEEDLIRYCRLLLVTS